MSERKPIEVGSFVPDFTLKNQHGNEVSLASLKGRNVILSFHPLAWTPVCRDQMKELDLNFDLFVSMNTVPLGFSVDSLPCKTAWAEAIGLESLQILSDFWPHGAVAQSLGLFRDSHGISERANVIVNGEGVVVFVKVYPIRQLPDIEEIVAFVREYTGTEVSGDVEVQHCMKTETGTTCIEDGRNRGINATGK